MKVIFVLLLFSFFLLVITACQKPEQVTLSAALHISSDTSFVNDTVYIDYTSNADSVCVTYRDETIAILNPKSGNIQFILHEAGVAEFHFRFTKKDPSSVNDLIYQETVSTFVQQHIPTIQVSASSTQLYWRDSCFIYITTSYGDSLATDLPGVDALSGSFPTPKLETTTTYNFALFNKDNGLKVETSLTIDVLPPTKEDTLCKFGAFGKIKIEFRDDYPGAPWYEVYFYPCESDDRYLYEESNPDMKMTHYFGENECFPGEPNSSSENASFSWPIWENDSGRKVLFEKLTADTLITQSPMGIGTGYRVRETYIHP